MLTKIALPNLHHSGYMQPRRHHSWLGALLVWVVYVSLVVSMHARKSEVLSSRHVRLDLDLVSRLLLHGNLVIRGHKFDRCSQLKFYQQVMYSSTGQCAVKG